MAANGGNNEHDADGQWPFDPLMMLDDFDDVMDLLHVPGGVLDFPSGLYSPPAALPMQNVATDAYGGNTFDWTAMPGNGYTSSVDGSVPPSAGTAIAAPSSSAHQDVGGSSSSVHQGTLDCTGCQILREIFHSNGFETTKLCIHGAAGVFYHVTLEVYHANPEGSSLELAHQSFVDFMGQDYAWVKHYLMDYAQQRASCGYTIVHDSTSFDFHDVLCTSMAGSVGLADDDHRVVAAPAEADNGVGDQQVLAGAGDAVQPMIVQEDIPAASGAPQQKYAVEGQQQEEVCPGVRSRLAIQRERTRKLELHDISRYFHLPMVKACKELRVCATVLKSLCRNFGVKRWPHRMIKRIDNEIAKLRKNGNGNAAAMDKIQKLTDSRRKIIIDGPLTET